MLLQSGVLENIRRDERRVREDRGGVLCADRAEKLRLGLRTQRRQRRKDSSNAQAGEGLRAGIRRAGGEPAGGDGP